MEQRTLEQKSALLAASLLLLTEDEFREMLAVWEVIGDLPGDEYQQAVEMYKAGAGATAWEIAKTFKKEVPVHG